MTPKYTSKAMPVQRNPCERASLDAITATIPIAARNAYTPKPKPCPIPVKTPWRRPPIRLFLKTTASDGPGLIAPSVNTAINGNKSSIVILYPAIIYKSHCRLTVMNLIWINTVAPTQ